MKLRFISKEELPGDVTKFSFEVPEGVSWTPGQFIHYTLPHKDVDERGDERWFTISSAPFENEISITTRVNGEHRSSFKSALLDMTKGDEIEADSPEGDFVIDDISGQYIFVIGGIGITPLRSILTQLDHDGKDVQLKLLYANRNKDVVPYKGELEAIADAHDGVTIQYFFDAKIGEADLKDAAKEFEKPIYYVSGPEAMVDTYESVLAEMGVDEDHSKFDYFPGYDHEV